MEVPLNCHKVSFRSFNRSNVYTARFLNCQHVIPFLQSFKRVHFVRYAAGCGKTFNLELACKALNIFPVVMSAVREGWASSAQSDSIMPPPVWHYSILPPEGRPRHSHARPRCDTESLLPKVRFFLFHPTHTS